MRNFRLLTADEIECRIKTQNANSGVTLLLYKTARTDAKILDETFGMFGWQNKYEVINDNLYCSIGVFFKEMDEWIWKSNCGTESNTEKEKGEASDALKRAGFTWGIGTELYSASKFLIWIKASDIEWNDSKCVTKFSVSEIGYDANESINHLVITGWDKKNGKREVFTYSDKAAPKKTAKPKAAPKEEPPAQEEPKEEIVMCEYPGCGKPITDKKGYTRQMLIEMSQKAYGHKYCFDCCCKAKTEKK